MAVDPEPVPPQPDAIPQESAQSGRAVVAMMEEVRQAAVILSESGNHVVQHTEMVVRQRACLSDGARQVSVQRVAGACVTFTDDAAPKEGMDEDEVEDGAEARPEGYLSGFSDPEGESRGFRDPLRTNDPRFLLTSPTPTLALPAPPGQVPLLLPPPPPSEPTSDGQALPAERNLKRRAEEQGGRSRKRLHVMDENREHDVDESGQVLQIDSLLPASQAHPGEVAEPLHSPPAPFRFGPTFTVGSSHSQRPPRQSPGHSQTTRKADWEPRFLSEFEQYSSIERTFRYQMWKEWTSGERRLAYLYTTNKQLKEEMKVWKRREERVSQERQGSAVLRSNTPTSTQDGGVESGPD